MELPILHKDEEAILRLRALYERYGYSKYKMSKFEEYDFYARNKSFLQSGSILTFSDLSGRLMALKPDVTLSIVKNATGRGIEKLYYNENVYRADDREFREIMQVGLECIGQLDSYTIAEVIGLAAESLGIIKENYVLDVSHIGVVSGLLEEMELSEQQSARVLKYLSRKNVGEMKQQLELWGADAQRSVRLCRLAGLYGKLGDSLAELESVTVNAKSADACVQLRELYELLVIRGCADKVYLDFSIAGETEYYNGVIFKGFVDGVPSAVLSGGRYDGLVEKLGKRAGAIGFAVYMNLLERLEGAGKQFDVDVLLCYEDGTSPAALSEKVKELMEKGYSVRVQKGPVGSIRSRKTINLSDPEVEELEENA